MSIYAMPQFFRLDDGSFINTFHIVRMRISDYTVVLTVSIPDETGSREITVRDPERVEKLVSWFVAPVPIEGET
jgi:hypothetical protein